VLELLNGDGSGSRAVMTISEMAETLWAKGKGKKVANSWVRNSLRRLMRAGLIEKVERGKFRISASGRKGATQQAA
jgi:Mn-dependent DtxR family transcriptional regulator